MLKPVRGEEGIEPIDEILNDAESFGTDLSGDSINFLEGPRPKVKYQPQGNNLIKTKVVDGKNQFESKTDDPKFLDR